MSYAAIRDAFYAAEDAARAANDRHVLRALNYQVRVQQLLIDRGLRQKGRGLITPDEMVEMDEAFKDGTTPEQFVDRIAEKDHLAKAPRIAIWCVDCPETFLTIADAEVHCTAARHKHTWRPSGGYAARMARTAGGAA